MILFLHQIQAKNYIYKKREENLQNKSKYVDLCLDSQLFKNIKRHFWDNQENLKVKLY